MSEQTTSDEVIGVVMIVILILGLFLGAIGHSQATVYATHEDLCINMLKRAPTATDTKSPEARLPWGFRLVSRVGLEPTTYG